MSGWAQRQAERDEEQRDYEAGLALAYRRICDRLYEMDNDHLTESRNPKIIVRELLRLANITPAEGG